VGVGVAVGVSVGNSGMAVGVGSGGGTIVSGNSGARTKLMIIITPRNVNSFERREAGGRVLDFLDEEAFFRIACDYNMRGVLLLLVARIRGQPGLAAFG
jgi:hypothetical protein